MDFDYMLALMSENACKGFYETEEYKLLYKQYEHRIKEYEDERKSPNTQVFQNYLEFLTLTHNLEKEFIYSQGVKDCVKTFYKLITKEQ